MTASQHINASEPDIFLSTRAVNPPSEKSVISVQDNIEMQESVTTLMGGISGLLFALSLSFFLQAPLVSGGLLFALVTGWLGSAFYQTREDRKS